MREEQDWVERAERVAQVRSVTPASDLPQRADREKYSRLIEGHRHAVANEVLVRAYAELAKAAAISELAAAIRERGLP